MIIFIYDLCTSSEMFDFKSTCLITSENKKNRSYKRSQFLVEIVNILALFAMCLQLQNQGQLRTPLQTWMWWILKVFFVYKNLSFKKTSIVLYVCFLEVILQEYPFLYYAPYIIGSHFCLQTPHISQSTNLTKPKDFFDWWQC